MTPSPSERGFERTFRVGAAVTLDAATRSGVIRISAGAPDVVRVRGILRASRSLFGWGDVEDRMREVENSPPVEQDGDIIRIGHPKGTVSRGILLLLDITVPPNTFISARADSGDIHVDGVRGAINCEADSGSIEVIECACGVRVKVDSGDIAVRKLEGQLSAEADSGSIEALEIAGPIDARADSGEIRIWQASAATIRAVADSGSIRVQLAPNAGYTLRARTESGDINVPEAGSMRVSSNEVTGHVRGGGPMVDLEVDSGSIDVN